MGRKFIEPNFDYKKYEEEEKESYNEKRKKEKKSKLEKKEIIENDNNFDNEYSINSIKLYDNIGKKKNMKLCC